ncbi:MAG: metalloregulator ArsR/SmtB family transcription factor [Fimbriimonadaceae bacterium]|nr:metalloregulator ArsR/SmtB family transcription factor [Fimbriimonadaceae bacterium]QYK58895.1 MAG: metalloregulator ArsR/SmtB family transcription factor [Fimbriimonadaceae bacterium]
MLDLFREVAEPSRRTLLVELKNGPRNVTDLVAATGMKQPNVSNHLAKLRTKGIVRATKVGRHVFYSLANADVVGALSGLLAPAQEPLEPIVFDSEAVKLFAKNAISGDEVGCAKMVDSLSKHGTDVATIYQELFETALILIGKWYDVDAINEGEEHLASAIIERLMARVIFNSPPPSLHAPKAVLGCSAGNWHSIGLRMVSDVLRVKGWNPLYLGANVPTRSFVSAVEEHQPQAAMVSCGILDTVGEALELVRQLRSLRGRMPNLKILAGGQAVRQVPERFIEAGADATVAHLDDLISKVLPAISKKTARETLRHSIASS